MRLTKIDSEAGRAQDVKNAQGDVGSLAIGRVPAKIAQGVTNVQNITAGPSDLYGSIGSLVLKLDAVKAAMDDIASVGTSLARVPCGVTHFAYRSIHT